MISKIFEGKSTTPQAISVLPAVRLFGLVDEEEPHLLRFPPRTRRPRWFRTPPRTLAPLPLPEIRFLLTLLKAVQYVSHNSPIQVSGMVN
jgi:hypothetical protein